MKTLIDILVYLHCFAIGWFVHSALVCAAEGVYDWRADVRWALAAVVNIVVLLWFFP